MINISVKEAKIYIERFFLKYGEVKNFFNEVILSAEKNGYVESLFGRKRYIA
jgi:DNA polymerase-1